VTTLMGMTLRLRGILSLLARRSAPMSVMNRARILR
jgi:hypothetical protein